MVRRMPSKRRRGGYHMPPKHSNPDQESRIEDLDRTLFIPNPLQQEFESDVEMRGYIRSHLDGGLLPRSDYRE